MWINLKLFTMDKIYLLLAIQFLTFQSSFTRYHVRRAPVSDDTVHVEQEPNDDNGSIGDDTIADNSVGVESNVRQADERVPEVTLEVKHVAAQRISDKAEIGASAFVEDDPNLDPLSEILMYMRMLSDDMTSLRTQVTNLKYDNHLLYKQLKKIQTHCSANEVVAPPNKYQPYNSELQVDYDLDVHGSIDPCPSDYTWNRKLHSCYKLAANRVSWRMARERCQVNGGDLVSIESDREQRYLNRLASENSETRHCDFWTSGTDATAEGQWQWVSQNRPFTYHNWNHNEPNNGSGREHCMQMLWVFNWAWNDSNCKTQNACYICEMQQPA